MSLVHYLLRRIDPDRLISGKTWWIIATLAALAGLLFAATVLLMTLGERTILKNVDMHDKFVSSDKLGKELDSLQKYIRLYEQNLWAYVVYEDSSDLQVSFDYQANITGCLLKIDTLDLLRKSGQVDFEVANGGKEVESQAETAFSISITG